jgi:hypothetical protein
MVEDPITLVAVVFMSIAHSWMAIMARDDSKAKGGVALLFLCCPPFALLYYVRMPRRKKKVRCLHWIFLVATAVVIYRVT